MLKYAHASNLLGLGNSSTYLVVLGYQGIREYRLDISLDC